MSKNNFPETLHRMLSSRRSTERKLAAYLLSEPEKSAVMSAEELAEASGVSTASVSRMLRSAGMLCFAELRRELSELTGDLPDSSLPVSDAAAAMTTVCGVVKRSVESCRSTITAEQLDEAASILSRSSEVCIIGAGTSAVTAQYAFTKLFRLGLSCSFSSDGIIMKMKCALMRRGSTLIAVSSSGCTKVVTESAALAKKGGANVIALSDYRVSPLARCADLLLTTTTRTSPDPPDAELPLIQGQLTVIDMLYSLLSVRLGNEKFELTRNIVKPDKQL